MIYFSLSSVSLNTVCNNARPMLKAVLSVSCRVQKDLLRLGDGLLLLQKGCKKCSKFDKELNGVGSWLVFV